VVSAPFAFVTATDLWSTMNAENADSGAIGMSGVAFAKYSLAPWP